VRDKPTHAEDEKMHLRDIYDVLADNDDKLMYEAQLGLGTVRRTLIGKRPDGRFLVEMFTFVPPFHPSYAKGECLEDFGTLDEALKKACIHRTQNTDVLPEGLDLSGLKLIEANQQTRRTET
jgi:hypothetical protein